MIPWQSSEAREKMRTHYRCPRRQPGGPSVVHPKLLVKLTLKNPHRAPATRRISSYWKSSITSKKNQAPAKPVMNLAAGGVESGCGVPARISNRGSGSRRPGEPPAGPIYDVVPTLIHGDVIMMSHVERARLLKGPMLSRPHEIPYSIRYHHSLVPTR